MTRVAMITPMLPPVRGGIGSVAYQDAESLTALGLAVSVYVPQFANLKFDAGNFVLKTVRPIFRYGFAAVVPQVVKAILENDVIVLHYPFFGGAEFLSFFPRGHKKLILVYHMDVVGRGFLAKVFKFYKFFILGRLLKRADKIVVSSHDYAQNSQLSTYAKNTKNKIVELPFSVDLHRFKPVANSNTKNQLRTKFNLATDQAIILMVGGLDRPHYFKGVPVALAAMTQVTTQAQLVIVGGGELKSVFEEQAKLLGLGQRVVFLGNINDVDLPDVYNCADLFIFPSIDRSEAFGLSLLEATACGLPSIATNLAGVRTLIGNNGRLVSPGRSTELAQAIDQLLADAPTLLKMSVAARNLALEKYSPATRKGNWQSLFQTL